MPSILSSVKPLIDRGTSIASSALSGVNRDKTTSAATPAPTDLAARREGRRPAPMGSKDEPEGAS